MLDEIQVYLKDCIAHVWRKGDKEPIEVEFAFLVEERDVGILAGSNLTDEEDTQLYNEIVTQADARNAVNGLDGENLDCLENRMFFNRIATVNCNGAGCGSPSQIELEPLPQTSCGGGGGSHPAAGELLGVDGALVEPAREQHREDAGEHERRDDAVVVRHLEDDEDRCDRSVGSPCDYGSHSDESIGAGGGGPIEDEPGAHRGRETEEDEDEDLAQTAIAVRHGAAGVAKCGGD